MGVSRVKDCTGSDRQPRFRVKWESDVIPGTFELVARLTGSRGRGVEEEELRFRTPCQSLETDNLEGQEQDKNKKE